MGRQGALVPEEGDQPAGSVRGARAHRATERRPSLSSRLLSCPVPHPGGTAALPPKSLKSPLKCCFLSDTSPADPEMVSYRTSPLLSVLAEGRESSCSAAVSSTRLWARTEQSPGQYPSGETGPEPPCHASLPSRQPLRPVRNHRNKVGVVGVTGTCENPSQMTFVVGLTLPTA